MKDERDIFHTDEHIELGKRNLQQETYDSYNALMDLIMDFAKDQDAMLLLTDLSDQCTSGLDEAISDWQKLNGICLNKEWLKLHLRLLGDFFAGLLGYTDWSEKTAAEYLKQLMGAAGKHYSKLNEYRFVSDMALAFMARAPDMVDEFEKRHSI